jgi:hypothetical protein
MKNFIQGVSVAAVIKMFDENAQHPAWVHILPTPCTRRVSHLGEFALFGVFRD